MKNENGLTLLEVLVSMFILAVGILGLAPMVVLSIEGNNISRDVLSVSSIAKEKLEYYQGLNHMPAVPFTESEQEIQGVYDRTTIIWDNTTDSLVPDGVYQIVVAINWTDKIGVSRSTTYTTLIEKR